MVNIERETQTSRRIHNKGFMILTGYVSGKYGQDKPLSLNASIGFEQTYDDVDGDSASSTELYALLSGLSGVPIKQGIAVTGSVNQKGEVQAIGGVTRKIKGYYDVCKAHGLTGDQGVMIPRDNMKNLMLREEVVQAVSQGKFHIYAVSTIDEGIDGADRGARWRSPKGRELPKGDRQLPGGRTPSGDVQEGPGVQPLPGRRPAPGRRGQEFQRVFVIINAFYGPSE